MGGDIEPGSMSFWRPLTGQGGGALQRELQSSLAALEELGPDYEPELREALLQRLVEDRRRRWPPPAPARDASPDPERKLAGAVLIGAALLVGFSMLAGVQHTSYHRLWQERHAYRMHRYLEQQFVSPPAPAAAPVQPSPPALPSN